jgi:hypothetical protein
MRWVGAARKHFIQRCRRRLGVRAARAKRGVQPPLQKGPAATRSSQACRAAASRPVRRRRPLRSLAGGGSYRSGKAKARPLAGARLPGGGAGRGRRRRGGWGSSVSHGGADFNTARQRRG